MFLQRFAPYLHHSRPSTGRFDGANGVRFAAGTDEFSLGPFFPPSWKIFENCRASNVDNFFIPGPNGTPFAPRSYLAGGYNRCPGGAIRSRISRVLSSRVGMSRLPLPTVRGSGSAETGDCRDEHGRHVDRRHLEAELDHKGAVKAKLRTQNARPGT